RLVYIPRRYADLLSMLDVGNGAPADRLFHGLLDVRLVATQEALTVDRALVLPVKSTVDYITHGPSRASCKPLAASLKLAVLLHLCAMPLDTCGQPAACSCKLAAAFIGPCGRAGTIPTAVAPVSRCSPAPPFG